jgi:Family of unknown function (DUF6159)
LAPESDSSAPEAAKTKPDRSGTWMVVPGSPAAEGNDPDSVESDQIPLQSPGRVRVKKRWGEQLTGSFAIGAATGSLFLVAVVVSVCLMPLAPPGSVFFGLAVLGVSFIAFLTGSSLLNAVFGVALYQYAVTGAAVGEFTADELAGSFVARKRGRRIGFATREETERTVGSGDDQPDVSERQGYGDQS